MPESQINPITFLASGAYEQCYCGYLRLFACMRACQVEKVENSAENIGKSYRPHMILLIPVYNTRCVKV